MRLLSLIAIGLLAGLALLPRPADAQEPARAFVSLAGFDQACLTDHLKACQVLGAGYLNAEDGTLRIAYQTQAGFTDDDGVAGGVVLLAGQADGTWSMIAEDYRGYRYDTPAINPDNLLHVAGVTGGTGAGNADMLFAPVEGGGWQRIDIEGWKSAVGEKLPTGLEIWKGVAYDFDDPQYGLTARTPLWRGDDGNCCPSGGEVVLVFTIENNALVVDEVIYRAPPQS